jgi:arginase
MKVKIIGVPSFSGALYSGTEVAPSAFREAGLINFLGKNHIEVQDLGDLSIATYVPRHNVGPIRNWPSPRIVWEEISNNSKELFQSEDFILMLGGDCSIITGSVKELYNVHGDKLYVICVDAHLDAVKPSSESCIGAAAMGLWFLCNDNMFYNRPENFHSSHISVLGTQEEYTDTYGISLYSLNELRAQGIKATVSNVLSTLPVDAKIFVHLDLDAIISSELSAVYAPSADGLSIEEAKELLSCILSDSRSIGMEVAEFSGVKDVDGSDAVKVAKLLAQVLKRS